MSDFNFARLKKMAKGKKDVVGPAMKEYEDKFGKGSIGRCSTWDLDLTEEEMAKLYRDCVKSGKEMEEFLGRAGDTGDDDL